MRPRLVFGLRPRARDARGQILVLFMLVLTVLLLLFSLVINVGLTRRSGQELANALDAAALAGAAGLPDLGLTAGSTTADYISRNFPGNKSTAISFRCVVGDRNHDGLPDSVDIPAVCDPGSGASWACSSTTYLCSAPCDPVAHACNTVVAIGTISAEFWQPAHAYAIGALVQPRTPNGHYYRATIAGTSGATDPAWPTGGGTVGDGPGTLVWQDQGAVPQGQTFTSAACHGACGAAPSTAVDVVLIIDRSPSMRGYENDLRAGARAVLTAYDPALQRVALGLLGPSSTTRTCAGTNSPGHGLAMTTSGAPPSPSVTGTPATANNGASGATTLDITVSPTAASGEFLLAAITADGGSATTITAPAGWTSIRSTTNVTDVALRTFYRIADGTDEASGAYTFTLSPSARATGSITRFTGVDQSGTPIDSSIGTTGAGNPVTASSLTPSVVNTTAVAVFASDTSTTFVPTTPSAGSMTEIVDAANASPNGPSLELTRTAITTLAPPFGASTNLAAAAAAGATNIKVVAVTNIAVNSWVQLGVGEVRRVTAVGTAGAAGTGLTLSSGLTAPYAVNTAVQLVAPTTAATLTGPSGGSSTLSAGVAAGATTITVASATNFTANDWIQLGTGEIRRITAVAGANLTITPALGIAYALGTTVVEQSATASQLIILRPVPGDTYGSNPFSATDMGKWIPVQFPGETNSTVPAGQSYLNVDGTVNNSSQLAQVINCFDIGTGLNTNLATPIAMAHQYLNVYGRAGVKHGIIMETDGAPAAPSPGFGDNNNYTCAQAQTDATAAKADGIEIYTIGYGGVATDNCPDGASGSAINNLANMSTGPTLGGTTCNASENTDGDHFLCKPLGGDLTSVFRQAALELITGTRLIQIP